MMPWFFQSFQWINKLKPSLYQRASQAKCLALLTLIGGIYPLIVYASPTTHNLTVKPKDNLYTLFKSEHIPQKQLQAILKLGDISGPLKKLKIDSKLSLTIDDGILKCLNYETKQGDVLTITHGAKGFHAETNHEAMPSHLTTIAGTIHHSLYQDTVAAGLPPKLVQPLANLFTWKVSLAKSLREGDTFRIVYADDDQGNTTDDALVAAEIMHRGELLQAICYQANEQQKRHCYTPEGKSLAPVFSRYPVKYSHISDHFNPKRKHPILHVTRPHWGVDFAAKKGTPIHATAEGKVTYIARKGGFGRFIEINHNNGITTRYAHLSRYKKGLKKGAHVKRNQIIGYVGKSGLSTGSHLHYEYRIHGIAKNPLTVKLPKGSSLSKKEMAAFLAFKESIWQT